MQNGVRFGDTSVHPLETGQHFQQVGGLEHGWIIFPFSWE